MLKHQPLTRLKTGGGLKGGNEVKYKATKKYIKVKIQFLCIRFIISISIELDIKDSNAKFMHNKVVCFSFPLLKSHSIASEPNV